MFSFMGNNLGQVLLLSHFVIVVKMMWTQLDGLGRFTGDVGIQILKHNIKFGRLLHNKWILNNNLTLHPIIVRELSAIS